MKPPEDATIDNWTIRRIRINRDDHKYAYNPPDIIYELSHYHRRSKGTWDLTTISFRDDVINKDDFTCHVCKTKISILTVKKLLMMTP